MQSWNIRSRSSQCALSEQPFSEGEQLYTAIYFDPETSGYLRRDVSLAAWEQELSERTPLAYWKTRYEPEIAEAKPEIAPKENAQALLTRLIEEDDPKTENARYILALMLERKRQLVQTAEKEIDGNKMLFYENKKTGEIFIVRDPELKLDEVAQIQEEVATILAFGGPAVEAAKAVGVTLTVDGVVPAPSSDQSDAPEAHAEESETSPNPEPTPDDVPAS